MKLTLIAVMIVVSFGYFAWGNEIKQYPAQTQSETKSKLLSSRGTLDDTTEKNALNSRLPHWYRSPEWMLIAVGIVTAFFIAWQCWETRRAAAATKASVVATERTIALMKGKERARVRIDGVELRLVGGEVRKKGPPRPSDQIEFKVFCYGTTEGFILESYYQLWIEDRLEGEPTRIPFSLPKAMRASNGGVECFEPIDWLTDSMTVDSVRDLTSTFVVRFRVSINYADVFQDKSHWEMQSTYTWNLICLRDADNTFSWEMPPRNNDAEVEKPN